jgi:NitT/TauT family transport system substrate-binding protein
MAHCWPIRRRSGRAQRTGRVVTRARRTGALAALALVAALACAPASSPSGAPPSGAAPVAARASTDGGPAAPAAAAASANPAPASFPRPEKEAIELAEAGISSTSLPVHIAIDAGYFQQEGLSVNLSVVSANVAVQGLVSNTIDIYQGGTATVAGRLGGADIFYVASLVDRSSLTLFGERGISSFGDFRGKSIATTGVGAFGEIALIHTARAYGMVPGQDFDIRYHPGTAPAATTFRTGGAQGVIITPPQSTELAHAGYPTVVDYYQQGLKIIGPATAVSRSFLRENPNTVRAFLRGVLAGLRRAVDDREYATAVHGKFAQVDDPRVLAEDYDIGFQLWNRDMTVDPTSITIVLESSPLPNARDANPAEFYDNSVIAEVNASYGAALFPEVFRAGR